MILADAINLVLAEYPGMKAIGAAESADAWIIGLDFASSTDDHPVPAVLFFQSPMLSRAGVTIVSIMTDGSSAYIACGMRVGK